MDFVPVPNTALVELVFDFNGQVCENTLYFALNNPWSEGTLSKLAEGVAANWVTSFQTITSSAVALIKVRCTSLESKDAPGVEYSIGMPLYGTATGDTCPGNVAVAAKFTTSHRGRSFRGRNFIMGILKANTAGNSVSILWIGIWKAAYLTYLNLVIEGVEADWVVVSRFSDKAPRVTGIATPVIGVSIEGNIDSQRRRLAGRGQ